MVIGYYAWPLGPRALSWHIKHLVRKERGGVYAFRPGVGGHLKKYRQDGHNTGRQSYCMLLSWMPGMLCIPAASVT